jgi:hypothetical protein
VLHLLQKKNNHINNKTYYTTQNSSSIKVLQKTSNRKYTNDKRQGDKTIALHLFGC